MQFDELSIHRYSSISSPALLPIPLHRVGFHPHHGNDLLMLMKIPRRQTPRIDSFAWPWTSYIAIHLCSRHDNSYYCYITQLISVVPNSWLTSWTRGREQRRCTVYVSPPVPIFYTLVSHASVCAHLIAHSASTSQMRATNRMA